MLSCTGWMTSAGGRYENLGYTLYHKVFWFNRFWFFGLQILMPPCTTSSTTPVSQIALQHIKFPQCILVNAWLKKGGHWRTVLSFFSIKVCTVANSKWDLDLEQNLSPFFQKLVSSDQIIFLQYGSLFSWKILIWSKKCWRVLFYQGLYCARSDIFSSNCFHESLQYGQS